jgi:hemerythrin superfamily protein
MQTIYTILKTEHRVVKRKLRKLMKKKNSRDFRKIFMELNSHMQGEEQCFYPTISNKQEDTAKKFLKEHKLIKTLMSDLESSDINDPKFLSTIKVLFEAVELHAKKEEETFPKLKKIIPKYNEREIAEDYLNFKEALS